MDHNITLKTRAQDAAGELPANPVPAPAAHRGQYEFPLIEIARLVAQLASQRDGMTLQQLQTALCPLDPASPLVLAARGACLERGYLADGSAPRFGAVDRREGGLRDQIGQAIADYAAEHMNPGGQVGIDWCSANDIDPLADTIAAMFTGAVPQVPPTLVFVGYADSDEVDGKTILDYVQNRRDADPDDVQPGAVLEVEAIWAQSQKWRVLNGQNPLEVVRISPPPSDPGGWVESGEHRPEHGQEVWVAILTKYQNAPPVYDVSPAVFLHGYFRDAHSDNSLYWPTHWQPRSRPEPPPLLSK